ncbi:TonB-dependent receptor plug domain-containing protein [Caulobacter segnis]
MPFCSPLSAVSLWPRPPEPTLKPPKALRSRKSSSPACARALRDALAVKQGSDKVVEAISAKDIGVLPDVTIAESIARLPGVNATRDRGNDSQAVVRGLERAPGAGHDQQTARSPRPSPTTTSAGRSTRPKSSRASRSISRSRPT